MWKITFYPCFSLIRLDIEIDKIDTRNCELQSLSIHIYLYNNLFFNDEIVTFRNYNGYINMSHLFETINFSRYKQFSVKDIFALISVTIYIVLLQDIWRDIDVALLKEIIDTSPLFFSFSLCSHTYKFMLFIKQ